jgi:hypothetical protein
MKLRKLFEATDNEVALIFGRFNPPHKGHRAAWEIASQSPAWYVGTNKSTVGAKDPLPFDLKVEAMKTIWPDVEGHVIAETSWLTAASMIYKKHGDVTLLCLTDEDWVTKTIRDYNGKEGSHGYYNFPNIEQKPTPRLSSATALRDAVSKGDRAAFSQAAGVDADTPVAGKPFFDLVAEYLLPYQNAPKKAAKKKEPAVAEGSVMKSIQRGLKGWQGSSHLTDIQDYIRNASDKTLLFLYKNPGESPYKQTPRDIQIKLINRELKRRYGVSPGEQGVAEVSKSTIDRYVAKASDAHGDADFAARMSKNDPDKRSYHVDQKKTAEKRRQGISRALDRMSKEGVAEGERIKTASGMYRDQHTGVAYRGKTGQDGNDSYMTPDYLIQKYQERLAQIASGPYKRPKEVAQLKSRIAKLQGQQGMAEGSAHGYNVAKWYEKWNDQGKLTKWLKKEAGLPKDAPVYFDDADLVYDDKTIVRDALVDPKLKFIDLLDAVAQAGGGKTKQKFQGIYREQGVAEAGSNAMADTAKRLANKDDGKVAKLRAAGDKRREDQLKGKGIAKRDQSEKDEWGNYKRESIEEARQSAQVRLAKAWDKQKAKSAASRERAKELLNPSKQEPKKDSKIKEDNVADVMFDTGERKRIRYLPTKKDIVDSIVKYYLKQGLKVAKVNNTEITWKPPVSQNADKVEDAAGVGIITKQNTTKDVNKGTLRKMMKGYRLI